MRLIRPRSQRVALTLLASMSTFVASWAPAQPASETSSSRLASYFARLSSELASAQAPRVETLELVKLLSSVAVDLQPDDADLQRMLLRAADLADDDDLRRATTDALARFVDPVGATEDAGE